MVSYFLKEVCTYSLRTDIPMRYVDIHTREVDSDTGEVIYARTQTIELPTDAAISLCASMATDSTVNTLLEVMPNGWMRPFGGLSLPGFAQRLAYTASLRLSSSYYPQGAEAPSAELKYVNVRVDMLNGSWTVGDSSTTGQVLKMCNLKPE